MTLPSSETIADLVADTVVSTTLAAPAAVTSAFEALGLAKGLVRGLIETGYATPTPIQSKAIPILLKGHDLLGLAETGTGKTAAFALPLLQRLAEENRQTPSRQCRALILAPTRELAIQIADSIKTYGKHLTITHTLIFGGVGSRPQERAMDRGVDIVVATPGRLLDLIGTRHVNLSGVTHFVLDEADRMLDMGFIHDVRRIVKLLPKSRQSLLFSATMPDDIARLSAEMLNNPQRVEVTRTGKTVDRITQKVHFVETKQKRAALAALLQDPAMSRVIVFTRTKRGANRVSATLDQTGIPSFAIHGNKSQNARQAALEAFKSGKARVLVATDIAARGIDIDEITHVINYELPNVPESYVHRIGRTARAGAEGIAIALCAPDERPYLRDIERLTKKPLTDVGAVAGMAQFANLPEPKRNPEDDDERAHFERGNRRIENGRRNDRPYEQRAEAPRADRNERGGRPGGDRKPAGDRPQGDRKPFGDRAGGDRPRGDRPQGARPFSARPAADRPRGPRPDGDRNSFSADRSDRGPRPIAAETAADAPARVPFDPLNPNTKRPQAPLRDDRQRDERPRFEGRREGADRPPFRAKPEWKSGDRPAPRGDGERRPFQGKPAGDRRDAPRDRDGGGFKPKRDFAARGDGAGSAGKPWAAASGDRRDGDRKPASRDGDRKPMSRDGDRKPPSRDGGRPPQRDGAAKPYQSRGNDRGAARGGDRRDDRGGKPAGPRPAFKGPRSDGSAPRARDRDTARSSDKDNSGAA
jgi:ATP-dependent RNA helicase RhlE